MDFENMTVAEIQRQLEQNEQNRLSLEKALEQRRQQHKQDLVQQIRDLILENGYDITEIASLLVGRKRRGPAPRRTSHDYARYVDPDNPAHVYVRGVIPRWMRERMQSLGLDPKSRQDRDRFKSEYLKLMTD